MKKDKSKANIQFIKKNYKQKKQLQQQKSYKYLH